jgi:hypothetical protein
MVINQSIALSSSQEDTLGAWINVENLFVNSRFTFENYSKFIGIRK